MCILDRFIPFMLPKMRNSGLLICAFIALCDAQNIQKFPATYSGYGITSGPDGAVWLTPSNSSPNDNVGRMTTAGVFSSLPLPAGWVPSGPLLFGPDGNLWLAALSVSDVEIIQLTTAGVSSAYAFDQTDGVYGMTLGSDGAFWLAENDRIGRITTSGTYSYFSIGNYYPTGGIATGPDGNVWFAALTPSGTSSVIAKITPTGTVTSYAYAGVVPYYAVNPVAAGPDGAIWFTIYATPGETSAAAIGRITTGGTITVYNIPNASTYNFTESSIAASPDGGLWFTGNGAVGRITTAGVATVYPLDLTQWATYAGAIGLGITAGSDGGMWFPVYGNNAIARATLAASTTGPAVSTPTLTFAAAQGQLPAAQSFQITSPSGSFQYSLELSYGSAPANWLVLNPASGSAGIGAPATIAVSIASAAAAFTPGAYTATINVISSQGSAAVNVTLNISAPAAPQATTTTLSASPTSQIAGQPLSLTAKVTPATATGTVTFLDGTTSIGSATLTGGSATLATSSLAAGSHTISASYGGDAGDAPSNSTPIAVTITPANQPVILTGGIVNAASFAAVNGAGSPVAPGSLVAIFTSTLLTDAASFTTATLPPSLSNVTVTFDNITAPIVTVSPTGPYPYVSAQVPFEVLPTGQTTATVPVVVSVNGIPSDPVSMQIVASAPGIFTIPATGQGNAVLVNLTDYSVAAPTGSLTGFTTHPITRGQSGFFYVTGLGAMTPAIADGSGDCPSANGLCNANATPQVLVGGVPVPAAQFTFAGQAPGFPGVEQINITIPANAPTGSNVSLVVVSADGTVTSNAATIAVQ